jgi:hypothetical protein
MFVTILNRFSAAMNSAVSVASMAQWRSTMPAPFSHLDFDLRKYRDDGTTGGCQFSGR